MTATSSSNTQSQQQHQPEDVVASASSRNIHEELRNELFSEVIVYPDSLSFYYVNEPNVNQQPSISYKEALQKPSETKIIKKPLLEEFTIDDPLKIDCTRKIMIIFFFKTKEHNMMVNSDILPGGEEEDDKESTNQPLIAEASITLKIM